MKIHNHWNHWRDHIILFGIQVCDNKEDKDFRYLGIGIAIFGIDFQFYSSVKGNFVNFLLRKIWLLPSNSIVTELRFSTLRKRFMAA